MAYEPAYTFACSCFLLAISSAEYWERIRRVIQRPINKAFLRKMGLRGSEGQKVEGSLHIR